MVSTPDLVTYVPCSSLVTNSRFSYTLSRIGRSVVRIQLTVLDDPFFAVMSCCAKVNACFVLSLSHMRKGEDQTLL